MLVLPTDPVMNSGLPAVLGVMATEPVTLNADDADTLVVSGQFWIDAGRVAEAETPMVAGQFWTVTPWVAGNVIVAEIVRLSAANAVSRFPLASSCSGAGEFDAEMKPWTICPLGARLLGVPILVSIWPTVLHTYIHEASVTQRPDHDRQALQRPRRRVEADPRIVPGHQAAPARRAGDP